MGFFDSLRRVLGSDGRGPSHEGVERAWGLDVAPDPGHAHAADPGLYDQTHWHKKLKRVLDGLPATQTGWAELAAEARALNLDPKWVRRVEVDEFLLLVRRAVADGHVTEEEHRTLDLARDLIGIPEAEAEAALHAIVTEAETFFGKAVDGA